MNLEPSADTVRRFNDLSEQQKRFRFPIHVAAEGDVALSEAVTRLNALAHPPVNMFAAKWTVAVEENNLGLPFTVSMMRSYRSYRRGRWWRTYSLNPSNRAVGLLQHAPSKGTTSLTAIIYFGQEAVVSAANLTVTFVLTGLIILFLTSWLDLFLPLGVILAIWAEMLFFPAFQWARLFRDRYTLKRTIEGIVSSYRGEGKP